MNLSETNDAQIQWLLQGDPSIRYQTLRDLTDSSSHIIGEERQTILETGWGKRLLDLQDEAGTWANSLYSPKWTSTFYTVLLLKRFGAPAHENIHRACAILLDNGFFPKDGGINYWKSWKHGECCITGMLLSMLCHFQFTDDRVHRMAEYVLAEQMPDKGWNCERPRGARHSSFHTTMSGSLPGKKAAPG